MRIESIGRGGHWEPPRPMESMRIGELRLRLGAQYLFVHHGSCEHALVFTRCSLLTASDAAEGHSFPRLVWKRENVTPICTVCARERAVWDVHGDRLADTLPCQLCQVCHYQAHYTKQGAARRRDYRIYPLLSGADEEDQPAEGGTVTEADSHT